MVDLVHIGVDGGAPSGGPDGQRAGGQLGQSLGIGHHLNVPAALVEEVGGVLEGLVGGVVGEVGACDGELDGQGGIPGGHARGLHEGLDGRHGVGAVPVDGDVVAVEVVTAVVAALILGVCPGDGGHGPVDGLGGTRGVVGQGQAGIHGAHDGLTDIDVGHLTRVDTDVTVAQLTGGGLLDALGGHAVELVDVVLGELGSDEVDRAVAQHVQGVGGGDHLIADLLDLGRAHEEVMVGLEVDHVVAEEGGTLGVVAVVCVGRHVSTRAHGDLDVTGRLDDGGHELVGAVFHAELIVGDIHGVALGVVVLGSHREGEVPDSLGVGALDGDLEDVVLLGVDGSAVGVVVVCHGVGAVLGGHGGDVGGVTQGNDARDVGHSQLAVLDVGVEDDLLGGGGVAGQQLLGGSPVHQDGVQLLVDLGIVDVLDGGFLILHHVGVVVAGDLLDLGLDVLVVLVLLVLDGDVALGVHEGGDLIELARGLVGLLQIGLLGGDVVGIELLVEVLEGQLVVGQQVVHGDLGGIIGNSLLVAAGQAVHLDGGHHLIIGRAVAALGGGLTHLLVEVDQLVDTVLGTVGSLLGDLVVGTAVPRADGLGAVVPQTQNVGGVHSGGAGVDGIQIHVQVEHDVLDGQGMTVGVGDAVLDDEGVGGVVGGAVVDHVVVLDHHGVLVAAGHHDLTVYVVGAQHTDLGHAHDGAVSAGGGEEGVEETVQLLGHDDQSVGLSAALVGAGREEGDRAQAHDQRQSHGKNSFTHFGIFLQ